VFIKNLRWFDEDFVSWIFQKAFELEARRRSNFLLNKGKGSEVPFNG
jgi:hypothetical protein